MNDKSAYRRVLIKVSGEALAGGSGTGLDFDFIGQVCLAIRDCTAMSAANEVAVGLFLGHKLGYNQIYDCAAGAVESIGSVENPGLEEILDADRAARAYVMEHFA